MLLCPNEDPRMCMEHVDADTATIVHWAVESLVDSAILIGEPSIAKEAYAYMKTMKPLPQAESEF